MRSANVPLHASYVYFDELVFGFEEDISMVSTPISPNADATHHVLAAKIPIGLNAGLFGLQANVDRDIWFFPEVNR